jgi:hypothetical protein
MDFRIKYLLVSGLLVFSNNVSAEFDHTHHDWNSVLKTHVGSALVDYKALSKDATTLDRYLGQLNSVSRREVDSWARGKQLAFWINAYNAFTVRAILDHYPIKTRTIKGLVVPRNSIIQIPGVWKKLEWKAAGQVLTIDHIEHGILRPDFNEPRMHFAIVCASIGCPDLRSEAYTHDKLEAQLKEQTLSFLSNSGKGVKLDYEKKKICVSQLFKWYNEDFVVEVPDGVIIPERNKQERVVLQFISHFLTDPKERKFLQSPDIDFDFLSYDWSLNDVSDPDDPSS